MADNIARDIPVDNIAKGILAHTLVDTSKLVFIDEIYSSNVFDKNGIRLRMTHHRMRKGLIVCRRWWALRRVQLRLIGKYSIRGGACNCRQTLESFNS